MKLQVNGEEKDVEDRLILSSLLNSLGVVNQRVAVAVNGSVITKSEQGAFILSENDKVEVVRMVGGG